MPDGTNWERRPSFSRDLRAGVTFVTLATFTTFFPAFISLRAPSRPFAERVGMSVPWRIGLGKKVKKVTKVAGVRSRHGRNADPTSLRVAETNGQNSWLFERPLSACLSKRVIIRSRRLAWTLRTILPAAISLPNSVGALEGTNVSV